MGLIKLWNKFKDRPVTFNLEPDAPSAEQEVAKAKQFVRTGVQEDNGSSTGSKS